MLGFGGAVVVAVALADLVFGIGKVFVSIAVLLVLLGPPFAYAGWRSWVRRRPISISVASDEVELRFNGGRTMRCTIDDLKVVKKRVGAVYSFRQEYWLVAVCNGKSTDVVGGPDQRWERLLPVIKKGLCGVQTDTAATT